MLQKLTHVVTVGVAAVASLGTLVWGVQQKDVATIEKGIYGALGAAGLASGVHVVQLIVDWLKAHKDAVESGLSIAQRIADAAFPQYRQFIDEGVKDADGVLDAIAAAKSAAPAAPAPVVPGVTDVAAAKNLAGV